MSLTITLYAGCKLTNKYNQVFKDRNTMATYLGTVTHLDVYTGDDIYFTNSGTISIDNGSLLGHNGDKYNYMQFTTTTAGGISTKRFAFVNNITIVNEVAVIEYSEDIWHTYAIKDSTHQIKLFNSLLQQAKSLNGGPGYEYTSSQISSLPKALPIQPEGQNAIKWYDDTPSINEKWCYVVVVGSIFKLTGQGEVNERFSSCYLLSRKEQITDSVAPLESSKEYYWTIDNQLLDKLVMLKAMSSDTQVTNHITNTNNWNYEIADIILIPSSIGDDIFEDVLTSDSIHNNELHQDFEVNSLYYRDLNAGQDQYYSFLTEIGFNNLILDENGKYIDNNGNLKYNYNGFKVNDTITYSKTFQSDYKYIALGNMSRIIPITFNGQSKTGIYEFCISQYDFSIKLNFDNTITDITSDLTLNLPISIQSADITQQQKIALRTGNLVQSLGLVGQTFSLGASIGQAVGTHGGSMQSDIAGSSSRMLGQGLNLVSGAIQLDSRNQAQYVANKLENIYDVAVKNCILGILREVEMTYTNGTLLDSIINNYGYQYRLLVNNFNTVYSSNNYIKFSQANVYENFSQEIARGLESILENGTILL